MRRTPIPQVAAVGLTEAQAREQHGDAVVTGRFPFAAAARGATYGEKSGFAKTIHENRYGELLGLVIVGRRRPSWSTPASSASRPSPQSTRSATRIAAHPTLAEAVKEAALVALGRPLISRPRANARPPR